jgi:tripartite-type tricarboxylate transporter receptor subunit TctC
MRRLLLAVIPALALGAQVGAQSAAPFYHGKTVTYVVATAPGGGYDTYGRLIARYLGQDLGDAKVIVQNVPGAGHMVGADEVYVARPDGLTIGTFNTGLIFAQLLKQQGVRFDLTKMSWIGKAASDPRVLVLSKSSGIKNWQELTDASKPPFKFYVGGVGSAAYIDTKIAIEALHLNVEVIPGFNGNEGAMSMLRGETAGTIGSESSLRSFVSQGNGFFALALGGGDASLPQASTFAKSDRDRRLLSLITAESEIERLTAGPPGIPPDRLAALRASYSKALTDPALLADAKRLKLPIEPADGPAVEATIKNALDQSPETIALLEKAAKAQ